MNAFDKIIGYEQVKNELMQIADVLKNADAYNKLGVAAPRGLLLHGKPGVGKSLMSAALIEASGRQAFVCRKDKPNGDFVKEIRDTFKRAKETAPSVVFLDDMDKFANGDDRHPDAEEYVTVQSCIDSVKGKDVFVLATANKTRCLPESLLRAGRFDRVIRIKAPRGQDAVQIIAHYIEKKKFMGDVDPVIVAQMMEGRSCAELETVINEAGLYAGFERSEVITMDHFMRACLHAVHNIPLEKLVMDPAETDLNNSQDQRALVIYHEAGHAAIAEALFPGSVTLVSAFSRDGENGGFTSRCHTVGDEETRMSVYGDIYISLGGLAATEQHFGVVDLGSSEDLDRAFDRVTDLIGENAVCGFHLHNFGFKNSQDNLREREKTAAVELERLFRRTKEILAANRDLLDAIAKGLAEKGVLTAADIARIKEESGVTSRLPLAV